MFDRIANRYDLINDVLSFGQHRRWRREALRAVDPKPGDLILDLAAGTGFSGVPFRDAGASVLLTDISEGMLRVGKERHPDLDFVAGDGLALPYADGVFDAVTISFGLRNFTDTAAGLQEMARVTRPGGRLVVCELSMPTWAPFRSVYREYLVKGMPRIAQVTTQNPAAYEYLMESILDWPDQPALADLIADNGWSDVEWRNFSGGIAALHRAYR